MSRLALLGLVDSLQTTVQNLKPPAPRGAWADYYNNTNYDAPAL